MHILKLITLCCIILNVFSDLLPASSREEELVTSINDMTYLIRGNIQSLNVLKEKIIDLTIDWKCYLEFMACIEEHK